MDRFLITGKGGMLAFAMERSLTLMDTFALSKKEFDLTNTAQMRQQIEDIKPTVIINCAAFTDVTRAESDPDIAFAVNGKGVFELAILCKEYHCKLVHISTDYVFPGNINKDYLENDLTFPVNQYGASKNEGERDILAFNPDALIVRVSWLYGPNGKNFVSTISQLLREKQVLRIVNDQFGKTTYTFDAVKAILSLLNCQKKGLVHFANQGVSSRYEFTLKIKEILQQREPISCEVLPIPASEYPDTTPRPTWSILNTDLFESFTKKKIRPWQEALQEFILTYC